MSPPEREDLGKAKARIETLTKMQYGSFALGASILGALALLWIGIEHRMTTLETKIDMNGIGLVNICKNGTKMLEGQDGPKQPKPVAAVGTVAMLEER